MGAACCNTNHHHIGNYMKDQKEHDEKTLKMLLLGPGSTGKTTLFKSLQVYHNEGVMKEELKKEHIDLIRYNVLDGIATLIVECDVLYNKDTEVYSDCQFIKNSDIEKKIDVIMKRAVPEFEKLTFDSNDYTDSELKELCECINSIWSLACIQATYKHRYNNFAISDNLEHFFNNLQSIFETNFVPNEKDCLLNRIRTTGMIKYEYKLDYPNRKNNSFTILDVGGQRVERRKWLHHFDKLSEILMCTSDIFCYYHCFLFGFFLFLSFFEIYLFV